MSLQPVLHPAVRPARETDVTIIRDLIIDLATFERSAGEVRITPEQLHATLFGPRPAAFALVAQSANGDVVGFALYFLNFSTWAGVHGIYLEDLYVAPDHRRSGLGQALLRSLAAIAVHRGYARFEWSVLNWNQSSVDFYVAMGAEAMRDWTVYRLTGTALADAAAAAGGS